MSTLKKIATNQWRLLDAWRIKHSGTAAVC